MIDLEALDFLYDYQGQSPDQKRQQIEQLQTESQQILDRLTRVNADLQKNPEQFLAAVHQLKSAALVLCANELNDLFAELNHMETTSVQSQVVSFKVNELIGALRNYQQDLQLLRSFIA